MTVQIIEFTIDATDAINSNHRIHYRVKARKTAAIRAHAYLAATAALANGFAPMERAEVKCFLSFSDRRERDPLNWADTAKAAVDGFVSDANILPRDDHKHLLGPDMRIGDIGSRGVLGLRFEFRAVEG